ncbi:hypothetical protein ACFVT1_26530 [Streptomyces sp. NPDC057963]|uniref:hypothetical protein n=1 Tax=Streptomyces sp. NPDC057963 TaxID=3346290 RepID=UPI0036DFE993
MPAALENRFLTVLRRDAPARLPVDDVLVELAAYRSSLGCRARCCICASTRCSPVPVTRLEHRRAHIRSRWYHPLNIACRHGNHQHRVPVAVTTTAQDRAMRDSNTGKQLKSDPERGFHRAEHLQQIPEPTLAHQLVYPWHADSESVHNQFGQILWNRRVIAYGLDCQKIFVLAYKTTSHQIFQNDSNR